jgi:glycosyltransferase involved in cell wall biosynthesis
LEELDMKVLFLIGGVGVGGHTRSAIAIARALVAQGVQVHIAAGGDEKWIALVKESGLPFSVFPTVYRKGYVVDRRSIRAVEYVVKAVSPDVIHAFDSNGLILGAKPARRGSRKLIYTICGGPVPRRWIPVMNPVVVFSAELKAGLKKKGFPEENVLVHAGRIELNQNVYSPAWLADYRRNLGIPEREPVILMISRIATSKLEALLHFVKTADCIAGPGSKIFLIVGAAEDPESLEELQEAIHNVNKKHKRTIILWTDQGSERASMLLPLASIAVGVGRTAYEAMNLGIPTMIIGNYGYSAVACEETCAMLMEKNFSGRDALDRPLEDSSPEKAGKVINNLLNDLPEAEKIGQEGRKWINSHLTSEKGAEFYARLYGREDEYFQLPARTGILRLYLKSSIYGVCQPIYYQLVPFALRQLISRWRLRNSHPDSRNAGFFDSREPDLAQK